MTVEAVITETVVELIGDALGPFPTVFPYQDASEVDVWLDAGSGTFALLDPGADYVLTGASSEMSGGQVQLGAALLANLALWPPGAALAMQRGRPVAQPSSFGDTSDFDPATSEGALDQLTRRVQELAGLVARTLRLPFGQAGYTYPSAAARAATLSGFDAAGAPIQLPVVQVLSEIGVAFNDDGPRGDTDPLTDDGPYG